MAAKKKEVKVKPGMAYTKSGVKKISGTATTSAVPARTKKMNALDTAISKGKSLPSKNKMYPGDSDVGMKGFSKKPVIKLKKK